MKIEISLNFYTFTCEVTDDHKYVRYVDLKKDAPEHQDEFQDLDVDTQDEMAFEALQIAQDIYDEMMGDAA